MTATVISMSESLADCTVSCAYHAAVVGEFLVIFGKCRAVLHHGRTPSGLGAWMVVNGGHSSILLVQHALVTKMSSSCFADPVQLFVHGSAFMTS